jgi:CheY-like chemotaxis protein
VYFGAEIIKKKSIRFFVKDSGIGIPEDKLQVIFDRFSQVDYSNTRKYGGAGLGLAISKGLVERLGGELTAQSTFGKGSEFSFELPTVISHTEHKETVKNIKQKKEYSWKGSCILITEDDDINYKVLELMLAKTGVRVLRATDGREAVHICTKNDVVDLVLMDLQLPEMDGFEATLRIKKSKPQLPIIVQTAHAMREEKEKSKKAACDDFITKPINAEQLYRKIDRFLKK